MYYLPLLGMAAVKVANHPCRSKNKADVADFEPLLSDMYLTLHQKIHQMKALTKDEQPSADTLLKARSTMAAPMANLQPVLEKPARKKKSATAKDKPEASELAKKYARLFVIIKKKS